MRENDFLRWIQSHSPPHPTVRLGIGDDMAAVNLCPEAAGGGDSCRSGAGLALLKIDQCLDKVHFDLSVHTPAQAGRKAVNRCLSDCAAMACLPAAIMISVALPNDATEAFAQELFLACQAAAARFDCPLVGGDTSIWNHPAGRLAITVAALGRPDPAAAHPPHRPFITRSGARDGDTLFVSGRLGGSLLKGGGGRHLTFEPRIRLAQELARTVTLHAMMDLSDGLAQDLPRLCTASAVGAQIHTHRLPLHEDAHTRALQDGLPAGLHALADGEDYELLFAIDPDDAPKIIPLSEAPPPHGIPLTAIGTITLDPRLVLIDAQGAELPWPNIGWEHKAK
jgi:thiamine-monophosphate kinase